MAIYVYETQSYQLQKVFTHADSNISALEWEPSEERYLAQATQDKKLVICEVDSENIKFNVTLTSVVTSIEWSRGASGRILMLL